MIVLVFSGRTAAEGMRQGINICLYTLIPSLFPFLILSAIATTSLSGRPIPGLSSVARLCKMPYGSEFLLIIGFLGGYPVGAGAVYSAYAMGKLSAADADRLAIFCNNAGPAFLFGILNPFFPGIGYVWCLWLIQIASAILTGVLLDGTAHSQFIKTKSADSGTDIIWRSARSMVVICTWVTIFRMVIEYLDHWFLRNTDPVAQVLFTGILELSNGCLRLEIIEEPSIRFLLATFMLSCGGMCILMQTRGVFPGLNIRKYLLGKLIHLSLSMILSLGTVSLISGQVALSFLITAVPVSAAVLSVTELRKRKIAVAIP